MPYHAFGAVAPSKDGQRVALPQVASCRSRRILEFRYDSISWQDVCILIDGFALSNIDPKSVPDHLEWIHQTPVLYASCSISDIWLTFIDDDYVMTATMVNS